MKKRIISCLLVLAVICSIMPTVFAASSEATEAAGTLNALGLFGGTGTDANGEPAYDLDRAPTRAEAVTMLVRLLGKEDEAKAGKWTTPFTDVPEWAKPYVGFAYTNKLTSGTGANTFGGSATISATQYITLVLRALGYESGTDFQWDKAWELSDKIGMTDGQYRAANEDFLRGDVAMISNAALAVFQKAAPDTLRGSLIKSGVLPEPEALKRATNYDPIIDYYQIPFELGYPQYNVDEIQQMIKDELTLNEVAEKISTLADLVQYLHQKKYMGTNGDLQFQYNGDNWFLNRSARVVFQENEGNCGGNSNLANYILRGDFDSQGYVAETANQGGHIYNYFVVDGTYYFCDFVQIIMDGNYNQRSYRVYETTDPQQFSDSYIQENHARRGQRDPRHLIVQYMYAYNGDHVPGSDGVEETILGYPCSNVLSNEIKDSVTILYAEDGYPALTFLDAPSWQFWPEEAQ